MRQARRPSEPDPVRTGEGSHRADPSRRPGRHQTDPRASHDLVIVADGDISAHDAALLRAAAMRPAPRPFIVAADGGAARCLAAGLLPDLVLGDLDSLSAEARADLAEQGVPLHAADPAKDESDLELCLIEAMRRDAASITILGALGVERPEHSLANLLLLADPRLDEREVVLIGHGARISRTGTLDRPGHADVVGEPGDYVSLFPIGGDVVGVVTHGLRFPLRDETLPVGPSRGLSNELIGRSASVTTRRGLLLVVHTSRSVTPTGPDPERQRLP